MKNEEDCLPKWVQLDEDYELFGKAAALGATTQVFIDKRICVAFVREKEVIATNSVNTNTRIAPLDPFDDCSPSEVESTDINTRQRDYSRYSPSSSSIIVHCLIIIYKPENYQIINSKYQQLQSDTHINFQRALHGLDPMGYLSSKTMVEKGISSLFTAQLSSLLTNYQLLKFGEIDNRIITLSQSFASNRSKRYGLLDTSIYYQYSPLDNYAHKGKRCLYPLVFMEFTKHATKPVDGKLSQSSLEANYLFRQMGHYDYPLEKVKKTPLLGVTFSEEEYIIKLYYLTVVDNQVKIAEIDLYRNEMNENFIKVIIPLILHFIERITSLLQSPARYDSLIADSTTIKINDYIYKSYDYREISNRSEIDVRDRRSHFGYKYSNLQYELVVDYSHPSNEWDSLQVIRYPYIEGTSIPTHVIHLLQVTLELISLHNKGMVHGDIRLSNMIFKTIPTEEQFSTPLISLYSYLIDFDFVGAKCESTYPRGFNRQVNDVKRHPDVCEGNLLDCEHDSYSLGSIFDFFVPLDDTKDGNALNIWEESSLLIKGDSLFEAATLLQTISHLKLSKKQTRY